MPIAGGIFTQTPSSLYKILKGQDIDITQANSTASSIVDTSLFIVDDPKTCVFDDWNGTVSGTVRATASSHGLYTGLRVQVVSTPAGSWTGEKQITKIDSNTFYFTGSFGSGDTAGYYNGAATTTKKVTPVTLAAYLDDKITAMPNLTGIGSVANALAMTFSDITLFHDANNADTSFSIGTSAAEALKIEVLNGGSNKTAEEIKISTATDSETDHHGKITLNVDGTDIATIDDDGIDLALGKQLALNGTPIFPITYLLSNNSADVMEVSDFGENAALKILATQPATLDDEASTGLHIDYEREIAGSGTDNHIDIGIDLDITAASLGSTSQVIGIDSDVVGTTDGKGALWGHLLSVSGGNYHYGLHIECGLATTESIGLTINNHNTSGLYDFACVSSANTLDYSYFKTIANGVTTIATVDATGGHDGGHLTLDIEGDITLDSEGEVVIDSVDGDITFKYNGTTLGFFEAGGHLDIAGTLRQRGGVEMGTAGNTTATTFSAITNTGTYAGKNLTVSAGSTTTGANNINGGDLVLASGGGDGTGTSSIQFQTKVSGTDAVAERMRIHTDGNIGIGTASPAVNLDIEDITTSSASQGGNLRLGSNDGAVMASGHRLGVLEFAGAEDTSSTMTVGARIEAVTDATWSASENGANLNFYTTDGNASQTQQMTILAAGNVGIGVADPDTTLEVNGNTKVTHTGTSTSALKVEATALTSGQALYLDINDSLTTNKFNHYLSVINYAKSGVTAHSQTSQTTGLAVFLADAATNDVNGNVMMTGALINVDSADAQGGISQTGLDINVAIDDVGDASNTYGIDMAVMDGGTDIIMKSSADTGDYCSISTTTHGATTIATEDDNAAAAHLTVATDGNIVLGCTPGGAITLQENDASVYTPSASSDATTKTYVDTQTVITANAYNNRVDATSWYLMNNDTATNLTGTDTTVGDTQDLGVLSNTDMRCLMFIVPYNMTIHAISGSVMDDDMDEVTDKRIGLWRLPSLSVSGADPGDTNPDTLTLAYITDAFGSSTAFASGKVMSFYDTSADVELTAGDGIFMGYLNPQSAGNDDVTLTMSIWAHQTTP